MSVDEISQDDIRWQCRRGMLELDILLNDFIDDNFSDLSALQYQALRRLLTYPDQVLLGLLLGDTVSSDSEIAELVSKIRNSR